MNDPTFYTKCSIFFILGLYLIIPISSPAPPSITTPVSAPPCKWNRVEAIDVETNNPSVLLLCAVTPSYGH